jgi:hypothetical protein
VRVKAEREQIKAIEVSIPLYEIASSLLMSRSKRKKLMESEAEKEAFLLVFWSHLQ